MARVSKAAYVVVDLTGLEPEVRQEIMEDAFAGGGEYGIRVVEETVNGSVRVPIFGVYDYEAQKWEEAKAEFNITAADASDEDEARIRAGAQAQTDAAAEAERKREEDELRAITKEDAASDADKPSTNKAKR